jgi:RHS repeat-associated protein
VNGGNLALTKRWQDPYGTSRGTPLSTWPDKHGFVGGYQNTTGLTHLGARDYDPLSGRFLTADPMLDTGNPQALNAYSYGNNSPVSFSDPSGLMWGAACGPDGVLCGTGEAMSDPNYVDNRAYFMKQRGYSQQSIDSFRHIAANSGCKRGSACSKQREQVRGHVKRYSPVTTDPQRLISLWSSLAQQIDGPRPFWNTATGEGDETACYGQRGCREAWIYLLGHGDDVAGAKAIAALYCIEHFDECVSEKNFGDSVNEALADVVMLLAMGAGGRLGADGEAASGAAAGIAGEDAAIAEREALGCPNSFSGNTLVLLGDGEKKAIENVRVGDIVANAEPGSMAVQSHAVVAVHITDDDRDFVDIGLRSLSEAVKITSTDHHLFWDVTVGAWVPASKLRIGHRLSGPDGGEVSIVSLIPYQATIRTYNLTIEGLHTFFVSTGNASVLVHNCGTNWNPKSVKTFGHTFNEHGAGAKNTRSLTDRARSTGQQQGQWLDNDWATEFLKGAHVEGAGPRSIRIPDGLGQVIMPDGSIVPARAATLVPGPGGLYRTAYPILGP